MTRYLDPKIDVLFKKIFGENKELLVSFLNLLLPLKEGQKIVSNTWKMKLLKLEERVLKTEKLQKKKTIKKNYTNTFVEIVIRKYKNGYDNKYEFFKFNGMDR